MILQKKECNKEKKKVNKENKLKKEQRNYLEQIFM